MFTTRHYKVIAEIIDNTRLTEKDFVNVYDKHTVGVADGICATLEEIVMKLADYFEQDNSRFNRKKFIEACGIGG